MKQEEVSLTGKPEEVAERFALQAARKALRRNPDLSESRLQRVANREFCLVLSCLRPRQN